MSRPDPLDALLDAYRSPAPQQGLADRVADAAIAHEQAPALGMAAPRPRRRDRRGAWLRRPMIAGGIALGLAFSGAVAATLAGVQIALPDKVQTALADVPFFGRMAKAEVPPSPALAETAAPRAGPRAAEAKTELAVPPARAVQWQRLRRAHAVRRMLIARRIVAERRATGLPTPRADRIERRLIEQGVLPADPVERAAVLEEVRRIWRERARARRELRRSAMADGDLDLPATMAPPASPADSGIAAEQSHDETAALNRRELRRLRAERFRAARQQRLERIRRWRERREQPLGPELEPTGQAEAPEGQAPGD